MHWFYFEIFAFVQRIFKNVNPAAQGRLKVIGGSLHSIMRLAIFQRLPLFLWFILQVIPLLQAAQHQVAEDVLVGLLD